jgi:hypothetical protein
VAYPVTYFNSTTDEASALPIVLTAGSSEEADIVLHALPSLHLFAPAPRKPDGSVALPELGQSIFGTEISSPGAGAYRDTQSGTVDFSGLAPGQYQLQQGDPPRLLDLDVTVSQQIDSSAGTPAASVSGTLHAVPDPGSAMTGETMLLLSPLDSTGRRQQLQAAARKGQFNFAAVPPGDWMLSVASSGNEWQILSIAAGGKTHSGNRLTVQDRSLTLAVTVCQGATRIEGFARKVVAPGDGSLSPGWKAGVPGDGSLSPGWKAGKGLAGAMIVLVPRNPGENLGLFRRDQSDSDGSFALLEVIPGQYTIVAIEDGWELDWARPEVIARYLSHGVAVTVDSSSGKLLRLSQPVPVQPR